MKKSKLDAVLRRKVRIKITRRKRGSKGFCVLIPAGLSIDSFGDINENRYETFPTKREALVYLYTKLRCIQPMVISVNCIDP